MNDLEVIAELDRMRKREWHRIARIERRIVSSTKIVAVEEII